MSAFGTRLRPEYSCHTLLIHLNSDLPSGAYAPVQDVENLELIDLLPPSRASGYRRGSSREN